MKVSFITITLLLVFIQNSFSQSIDDFRFGGNMKENVWSKLTTQEQNLFYECVKECGLNKDSIVWAVNVLNI